MSEADDKMMAAGFDHPCRETCSGWKQGKMRGEFDSKAEIAALKLEITHLASTYEPNEDCVDAMFECDFKGADDKLCPCQVAMKHDPKFIERHGVKTT